MPVRSAGSKSGVNWMRRNGRSSAWAKARTARVLARPGTPSIKTWPPAKQRDHQPFEQGPLAHDQVFHPLDEQSQPPLGRRDFVSEGRGSSNDASLISLDVNRSPVGLRSSSSP